MTDRNMLTGGRRAGLCDAALAVSAALGSADARTDETLFDGCPSGPIIQRFIEFGQAGKMPPDPGKWLNAPWSRKVGAMSRFISRPTVSRTSWTRTAGNAWRAKRERQLSSSILKGC